MAHSSGPLTENSQANSQGPQKEVVQSRVRGGPPPHIAFRGSFNHSLDAKGRVSLPSEFRRVLGESGNDRVVVTNNISQGARCLEGYGEMAWREFEVRLREKSRFDPTLQKLENYFLSRATECVIDSAGRIMLPPHLRTYAGFDREVTFTSSIHGFRIWDKRVWDHIFEAAEIGLMEDPAMFAALDV